MCNSPSFDWTSFLDLSRELIASPTPARLRSGIGRAYYAIFNKARRFLEAQGKSTSTDLGRHQRVWVSFKQSQNRKMKTVGNLGATLLRQRNNADYDDEFKGALISTAQLAVEKADQVLDHLESLASSS